MYHQSLFAKFYCMIITFKAYSQKQALANLYKFESHDRVHHVNSTFKLDPAKISTSKFFQSDKKAMAFYSHVKVSLWRGSNTVIFSLWTFFSRIGRVKL